MTQKQLAAIVDDWQYRLGLERWEIKILWGVAPETFGVAAEVDPHEMYDIAKVRFGAAWPTWTVEFATKIVIHELLHVLHNGVDRAVDSAIADLTPAGQSQAEARYEREIETFIDRVALRMYEIASV